MFLCLQLHLCSSTRFQTVPSRSKRDQVVALMQAGLRNKDVTKKFNVCPKTVYYTKIKGTTDSKHVPRRERSTLKGLLTSGIGWNGMTLEHEGDCEGTQHLANYHDEDCIEDDLGLEVLKMHRWQLISAPTKQKRLDRGKQILEEISSAGNKVFIRSNERIFTVEVVSNSQNDRIYAHHASELAEGSRTVFRRQLPAAVLVWAAVGYDGSKSPFIFIDEGVMRWTVWFTWKCLEDKVLPWLNRCFWGTIHLHSRWRTGHHIKGHPKVCNEHFVGFWDKNIWPPSSPDINPMDFAIWYILETEVSKVSYSSVSNLKQALTKAWSKLD